MTILIKKISKSDLNFTFFLRNNKLIRKESFNSEIITIKDHKEWFFQRLKNKKSPFFIIFHKKTKVGTLRYDKQDFFYNVSISILPKYQSLKIGSIALNISENLFKKTMIVSKIKKNNLRSLNFFNKNGYSIISEKPIYTLYKVINKKENQKNNYIIDQIQQIRKKNNVNWMDILRLAFKHAPNDARKLIIKVNEHDSEISKLVEQLSSNGRKENR